MSALMVCDTAPRVGSYPCLPALSEIEMTFVEAKSKVELLANYELCPQQF